MAYSASVLLSSSNFISVSGYAPFALTIDPLNVSLKNKVYSINYNFGDGTIINQNLSLDLNGDPLYVPQTHNYYISNTLNTTLSAVVSFYQIGVTNPSVYTIALNLYAPAMESSVYNQTTAVSLSGYFQEMHLIGSRMFGPNNNILYMFESINPNYIIPVIVNWKTNQIIDNLSLPM